MVKSGVPNSSCTEADIRQTPRPRVLRSSAHRETRHVVCECLSVLSSSPSAARARLTFSWCNCPAKPCQLN